MCLRGVRSLCMELKSIFTVIFCPILLLPLTNYVEAQDLQSCGVVRISQILEGPQRSAIIRVSNTACGNNGLLCINIPENKNAKSFVFNAYQILQLKHFDQERVSISVDMSSIGCSGRAPLVGTVRVNPSANKEHSKVAHQY